MFSNEQAEEIKKRIISHIDSSFPEDKKDEAKEKVSSMDSESLEEFLRQNNLIKEGEDSNNVQCIFCLIESGKIPSYKLEENDHSLAVLEINPISKGHVLIIPKVHSQDGKISKETYKFAEKFSDHLRKKLNPKGIILSENHLFNHGVVNLIPVYTNETINSPRTSPKKEELEDIQKMFIKKAVEKKPKKEKIKKTNSKKKVKKSKPKVNLWLPKRIP